MNASAPYNSLKVADYIVQYCDKENLFLSNARLQNLLYFVQAYYLIETQEKTPCFYDSIYATAFGAMVPKVYSAYKKYGAETIPTAQRYFMMCLSVQDQAIISQIINYFSSWSTSDLSRLVRHQDPWLNAY